MRIHYRTSRGSTHRSGRHKFASAQPENQPCPLGKQILVEKRQIGFHPLDPSMAVQLFHFIPTAPFPSR